MIGQRKEISQRFPAVAEAFDPVYNGIGMPYCMSYANEIITKAVCVFNMTGGNLKDTIITAVNLGRDTDCVAAVAVGLAGALDARLPCRKNGPLEEYARLRRTDGH